MVVVENCPSGGVWDSEEGHEVRFAHVLPLPEELRLEEPRRAFRIASYGKPLFPWPSMPFNLSTLPGCVIIVGLLAVGWCENKAKADKFIGEKSTQSHDTQRWLILAQEIPQLGMDSQGDCVWEEHFSGWWGCDEPWPGLWFLVRAVHALHDRL